MLNVYKTKPMRKHLDEDFYNPKFNEHHISNKHLLVCGGTGTGKSNFLINLIHQMTNTFSRVIIVTKQLEEPIYAMLKVQLKENCRIIPLEELETLEKLPKVGQQLIVFDDFCNCSKQQKLDDYVIRARKYKIICCFLTQSFFATSKIIRQNCGYIVLLALTNQRDFNLIVSTFSFPISKDNLKKVIRNATQYKMNVCIIDVNNPDPNSMIRRNFNDFYTIVTENGNEILYPKLYAGSGLIN